MIDFLKWTAWEMEKPNSYGMFHIVATVVLLTIAIVGAYLLRNTNDKQNRIVLGVTGGVLLLFEVYKLLFHIYLDPYGWGGFWGVFPFQLCSLPMYLSVVCACCKNEKINSWLYECMFSVNIIGGIIAFVEPSGINHPYLTLTLHAYIWHMALIFIAIYLYASKRVCKNSKDYYKAVVVYFASCLLAQVFNLLFAKYNVNCYYISPFVGKDLPVFSEIAKVIGWASNTILLPIALMIGSALIYYVFYMFRKKKNKDQKAS